MKEYYLRSNLVSFITILEIHMVEEVGQHGRLKVTGYINDEDEEEYLKILCGDAWEKIELVNNDGKSEVLFYGIVTDFSIVMFNDQKKLTLELMTGSCLLDVDRHLYSYQEPDITYDEIFSGTVDKYVAGNVVYNSFPGGKAGELILQYDESDWEFLTRMASRSNLFLVPESRRKGVIINYGLPEGKEINWNENISYTVEKDIYRYKRLKKGGLPDFMEEDSLTYKIFDRELHYLGDYAKIKGKKFYVYKIMASYERGEMIFEYSMCLKGGMNVPEIDRKQMGGCALEAIVTNIKEDKVQVRILKDENVKQEVKVWYPYSTVYSTMDGTGWYCMPEPGDEVRLTIPGSKEKEAFVSSSVHMETESSDRKDPEHKIFKNKYKKEVRFTPDSILITNNQGTKILLKDGEGIQIVSAHSIMLEAVEDITISSETGSLIAAGTSVVDLKQKGTGIHMEEGISFTGGKLQVQ